MFRKSTNNQVKDFDSHAFKKNSKPSTVFLNSENCLVVTIYSVLHAGGVMPQRKEESKEMKKNKKKKKEKEGNNDRESREMLS
jgi:hypothetical protein